MCMLPNPARCSLFCYFLIFAFEAHGQLSFYGGANISTVRTEYVLGSIESNPGYQVGCTYVFNRIFKSPVYPYTQFEIIRKGYVQDLHDKAYKVNFSYAIHTLGIVYRPFNFFSVNLGTDFSSLFKARQYVDADTFRIKENFRDFDLGLRGGICFFENKIVNFYASYIHGMVPMLAYTRIDEMGNFTDKIKDIRNVCIQAGLRITFNPYVMDEKK